MKMSTLVALIEDTVKTAVKETLIEMANTPSGKNPVESSRPSRPAQPAKKAAKPISKESKAKAGGNLSSLREMVSVPDVIEDEDEFAEGEWEDGTPAVKKKSINENAFLEKMQQANDIYRRSLEMKVENNVMDM